MDPLYLPLSAYHGPKHGVLEGRGSDLYSARNSIAPAMEKALVKAGIQVALPSGCYGQVVPHSGSAASTSEV